MGIKDLVQGYYLAPWGFIEVTQRSVIVFVAELPRPDNYPGNVTVPPDFCHGG